MIAAAASGGMVLVLSVLILLKAGYRVSNQPPTPTPALDFDAWPMPEVVAVEQARPAVPEARPKRVPDVLSRGPRPLVPPDDLTSSLQPATRVANLPTLRRKRTENLRATSVAAPSSTSADLAAGMGSVDLSLGGARVQRDDNVVLDDPIAIRMMIGDRLRRGIPELRGCYDRRLKQRPDLSGSWRLRFTVSRDGRATHVDLDGLDAADEELEGCLRAHVVRRWGFAKVTEPTEVTKTLRFHVAR